MKSALVRNHLQFLTGSGAVAHRGRQHQERSASPEATCSHGHYTQTLASRHLSRCLGTLTAEVENVVTAPLTSSVTMPGPALKSRGTTGSGPSEVEKPGLLPPRPETSGAANDGALAAVAAGQLTSTFQIGI